MKEKETKIFHNKLMGTENEVGMRNYGILFLASVIPFALM